MTDRGQWYAQPLEVHDPAECYFYHTVDLPTYGLIRGEWDLRGSVDAYLGHERLAGKRVLEIGTADGYLCFEMEKRGAEVVGYDLSDDDLWDIVPYRKAITDEARRNWRAHIGKINNAWWLMHRLLGSKARAVYGTAYSVPPEIGPFDVATFGSILLHLRDPFLALQRTAAITTETLIVTDVVPSFPIYHRPLFYALRLLAKFDSRAGRLVPELLFLPDPDRMKPEDTWWNLSPGLVCRFLRVLGFPNLRVSYHTQEHRTSGARNLYTVVGKRS